MGDGRTRARPAWHWTLAAPFCAAHRGGGGLQPENTLAAFETAASTYGCAFLELDVHSTADGIPVVIHDPTVDRTTDGHGFVRDLTLAELRAFDAACRFVPAPGAGAQPVPRPCPIPTLEEVLSRFPQCWFSIDLKQQQPACERAVVDVIRRTGSAGRVLLGAEQHGLFRRIRAAGPEIPSFFTRASVAVFWAALQLGVWRWYRPPHHTLQVPERLGPLRVVTPRFVRAAHGLGLPVIVWTVNDEAGMRRLLAVGVDGLMTDRPDLFNQVVGRWRPGKG